MATAYLQNKKAQYYYLTGDGSVALGPDRRPLQTIPETRLSSDKQTSLVFRHDGRRILAHLFLSGKMKADCILTLEHESSICGELDFSSTRLFGSRELWIDCYHF